MSIALPPLPFPVSALEPHISRSTVEIHYGQHHAAYVARTNEMLAGTDLADLPLEEIVHVAYENGHTALFSNAAQAWNHTFYWRSLLPDGGGYPHGTVATLIEEDFGSYEAFVTRLRRAATSQFGSGWAWLVLDNGHLQITQTANAENPLVDYQVPVLAIDVWEHAYYLDYQHRRTNYVAGVTDHLLNWDFANQNLKSVAHLALGASVTGRAANHSMSTATTD